MKHLIFFLLILFSYQIYAEDIFLAQFKTLNPQVNGTLSGSTSFWIKDDRLVTYSRLFAGAPKTWHMQNVYLGKRCPGTSDDLNLDGYLDVVESALVVGNIIVPLDGDISSQMAGLNIYPVADDFGGYFYEKDTKYSLFTNDLKDTDPVPGDNIVKLGRNDKFSFEGKVVMVQGTSTEIEVPATVSSYGEIPVFKTLPIACGVIKKISR
jgi:hypothetical protein